MSLSSVSINRPVLAIVMSLLIVIFGAIGFRSLAIREYPSVDPPIITVQTGYTGASADVIQSQITEPLEEGIHFRAECGNGSPDLFGSMLDACGVLIRLQLETSASAGDSSLGRLAETGHFSLGPIADGADVLVGSVANRGRLQGGLAVEHFDS